MVKHEKMKQSQKKRPHITPYYTTPRSVRSSWPADRYQTAEDPRPIVWTFVMATVIVFVRDDWPIILCVHVPKLTSVCIFSCVKIEITRVLGENAATASKVPKMLASW